MHEDGRGKIIPPLFCFFLGQAGAGLALMSGTAPAQTKKQKEQLG